MIEIPCQSLMIFNVASVGFEPTQAMPTFLQTAAQTRSH
jgi:hypothetical protein